MQPPSNTHAKRKILIVELWGLGDLTFTTPLIQGATGRDEVHLLAKPYAKELLQPSYPAVQFWAFDAPWTQYTGKYNLLKWKWIALIGLIRRLRGEKFDLVVSVRSDPRDHVLAWLIGARQRFGYPRLGSGLFLTDSGVKKKQHRLEDWLDIAGAIGFAGIARKSSLNPSANPWPKVSELFDSIHKPVICLHAGARIPVRRWPEAYFATIIEKLRQQFDFHLILIPDPDGYGSGLAHYADTSMPNLSIGELIDLLGRVDLLLCNDSGPGHIASACGRPVISFFGPESPQVFRPWGENNKVIIRDICPLRPCKDYCKFPEPYCMTQLMPDTVWPEIDQHLTTLVKKRVLPAAFMKAVVEVAENRTERS